MRKVILSIIIGILMFVVGLYGLHLEIVSPKEGEEFTTQIPVELKIDAEPGEVKKLRFYINNKLVLETEEIRETYILDISPLDYSGEVQLSIIAQAQREIMKVETNILINILITHPVWLQTFGGERDDWANEILQTQDGGYLIVGGAKSFGAGGSDVYVLKLDKDGNKQWEKTFGGEDSDWVNAILQTEDGGYLIVGKTESFGAGGFDVYVLKLDKDGNKQWEKTFGGKDTDEANAVLQTQDGGYLIVGWTKSFGAGWYDVYVLKIDKEGNKQWEKTFGGEDDDRATAVLQTQDGGYLIVGSTESFGAGWDVYVLKIDKNGKKQWEKSFGGSGATGVVQTQDGGYLIVGETTSFGSDWDVYVLKIDKNGKKQWEKTFGGEDDDRATVVLQTHDGGYLIVGGTWSFVTGWYSDVYVLKLDKNGNKQWEKTFGGNGATGVVQTQDGGFLIVGKTYSFGAGGYDVYVLKLDKNGNKQWEKTFGGKDTDEANAILQTQDGGFLIVGSTESFGAGGSDILVLKLSNEEINMGKAIEVKVEPVDKDSSVKQMENGFIVSGKVKMTIESKVGTKALTVYLGKEKIVESEGKKLVVELNAEDYPKGLHNLTVIASVESYRRHIEEYDLIIENTRGEAVFGGRLDEWAKAVLQTQDGGYLIVGETTSFGAGGEDVYVLKIDKNGNKQWEKTFGGERDDEANAVLQTEDGGYLIVGSTESFGAGWDVYVLKLDKNGNKQWEKTFGGEDFEWANAAFQTQDGGYLIVGGTKSFGAGWDVYVLKLDKNGNKQLEKTFGGERDDWAKAVLQTQDGGYLIVGETRSFGAGWDVYVLKLDKNGNKQWEKTFGGEDDDWATAILQTEDGGYLIVGSTESFGAGWYDVYVLKLDKNGNKQWEKTFGGEDDDWATAILQTEDGGYLIVGSTESFGAGWDSDVYVLKLDKNGNKQWEKTFGGKNTDEANAVLQTEDGGYLIVGKTESFGAGWDSDVYVLKLDKNGNKQWEKTFGGKNTDEANAVLQTEDGGYLIVGKTESFGAGWDSDVYVLKLDKNGNKQWEKTFGGKDTDEANAVLQTEDGGYLIVGKTESFGAGEEDVYIVFLDKDGNLKKMK